MINKIRKYLLLPFSGMYFSVLYVRHWLFDNGIIKSWQPNVKTICVGNLSFGGTGKTPFIEYLISHLLPSYKIAVVSRGYRRKSIGLKVVNTDSDVTEVGDEPFQIKNKFPKTLVIVCEKRKNAIQHIQQNYPEINLILLDDAFQHRAVKSHINLLLTTYQNPFINDWLFPSGNLRDIKSRADKATAIIVTKSSKSAAKLNFNLPTFYSSIQYQTPQIKVGKTKTLDCKSLILIAGIANNQHFFNHFDKKNYQLKKLSFSDHHNYTTADVNKIIEQYKNLSSPLKCIVTTEKDWMKLKLFSNIFERFECNLTVLPIQFDIHNDADFLNWLQQKIEYE